ncbi:hypothetical protein SAMN05216339_101417 [Nitrosomonas eutropha]|uniref:Uncharacterized protein n=1 Tax=Nitrosomonas eutropha TaxID=916 RepID=A0A1I7FCJ7_9PROT|nr:hypothetical protein [Nitrosomonas eutropha]SFU33930.1 hypothetical protein SAMN05216339_101417 [Nitrosomonas eutropha]
MNRFIPENAETREFPAAAIVAYCYESKKGPAFVAYKGRQSKPCRFLAFADDERRETYLAELVKTETEMENCKRARRETAHDLSVGDILFSSWGYDQTNVDFYEVVRVPSARSAVVRQIKQATTASSSGNMAGVTVPNPGEFVPTAKESTRRAAGRHCLYGGNLSLTSLQKWDGKPKYVSWYA